MVDELLLNYMVEGGEKKWQSLKKTRFLKGMVM